MPETYNGWTNYATWRVSMEICNDYCDGLARDGETFPDTNTLARALKDYVEDIVCEGDESAEVITTQYAMAFIDNVSWDEIAGHWVDELLSKEEDTE